MVRVVVCYDNRDLNGEPAFLATNRLHWSVGNRHLKMLGIYLGALPTFLGFVSGGERHFIEVCKRLKSQDFDLTLLTTESGQDILTINGIDVRSYRISTNFEGYLQKSSIGMALLYAIRILKSTFIALRLIENFDIICASSHFIYDVLPAMIISKKNQRSTIVVYLHHLSPNPFKRSKYNPALSNILAWIAQNFSVFVIRHFINLVLTCPAIRNQLIQSGISKKMIRIIYNGLDLREIEKAELSGDKYEACFVGRLYPLKGIFDLIDIWKNIHIAFPNAKLAIIGSESGRYVDQFKKRIKVEHLERNILLLGALSEEGKYGVLKACNFFIFPSYEEGWGIPLYEALACGLPVVAYNLPAYEPLGSNCIIKVPVGDKKAFSEAVLKLLSDEKLRMEIGEKSKKIASKFEWDKIIEKELETLKNATINNRSIKQTRLDR